MEIAVLSDAISSIAYTTQSLGFSNLLLNRPYNVLSLSDVSSDQGPQSPPPFHISAASPPPTQTLTRRRLRKARRVKRKIAADDGGDLNNGDVYFGFGDGGDINNGGGYFGRGGGGKGWNFGGSGGSNWGEYSDNSIPDPAFDFVYEVLCWIAMSNCLHFAFKKVGKVVADGFGDREKIPMRLTTVC
ncbi:glycine-rich protein [Perilla frutescens var. frutescens]|nr:glycine-rich protein [Perilla frutescens var. frutescens]